MTPATMRRFGTIAPTGTGHVVPAFDPAYRAGRTIFGRRVYPASEVGRVLKSGHNNRKIGKVVTKGRWKGMPIYMLTLEERATRPRDCKAWATCYGNNLNWAQRIVHGGDLEAALERELADLNARHPRGFVIRLHVLGDFYSVAYVYLWRRALAKYPALRVFGYTARDPQGDPIGKLLDAMSRTQWDRFAIRFSGRGLPERGAEVIDLVQETPAIICPAQTGATDCCGTCGLCWQTQRNVAFLRH